MPKLKNIIIFLFLILFSFVFIDGGRSGFIEAFTMIGAGFVFLLYLALPRKDKNSPSILVYSVALLAVGFLAVCFFSSSFFDSFYLWRLHLAYFLLFWVVSVIKWEEKDRKIFFSYLIFLGLTVSLIGIYFYLTGSYRRLTSVFYWPNPLASYLLLIFPLVLSRFFESKRKIFYVVILGIIGSAFLLAFSRGAILAFLLSALVVFMFFAISIPLGGKKSRIFQRLLSFKVWKSLQISRQAPKGPLREARDDIGNKKYIFAFVFLAISLFFVFSYAKKDFYAYPWVRGEAVKNGMDVSAGTRLDYWQGAVDIASDFVLTGSGPGTFGQVYPTYQQDPYSYGKYPHNVYLLVLAEFGLSFFILLLLVAYIFVKKIFKNLRQEKSKFKIFLLWSCLGFAFHLGVDVGWHFSANAVLFSILLGLLVSEDKKADKDAPISKFYLFFGVILALGLVFGGFKDFFSYENLRKAQISRANEDYFLAVGEYRKALFWQENPQIARELGFFYLQINIDAGKDLFLAEAEEIAGALVQRQSFSAPNYDLAGRVSLAQKKPKQAQFYFEKALFLDRYNSPLNYLNLAISLERQGKREEAVKVAEKGVSVFDEKVIQSRKMKIMSDQEVFSPIEEEVGFLRGYFNKLKYE